jgi:cytochrome c biogenesis protein CcdA
VLARRLDGQDASAADGWRIARERIRVIAGWTMVVCTVGAVLRILEEYVPLGGKLVVWLADVTWSLATLFALPVIAYEDLGPRATLKRSATLFRQRWAEQTLGTVGIGVGAGFLLLPCALAVGVGVTIGGPTGIVIAAIGGAGTLAVLAVQVALDQIFRVFVYRNAIGVDGGSSGPFPLADLERPFLPRKRWFASS